MKRVKSLLSLLLAVLLLGLTVLPGFAADVGEKTYPEEFFWDKAGDDADNGYKAYSIPFGAPLQIPPDPAREGVRFLGWKDWNTDEIVDLAVETMNAYGRRFYAAWSMPVHTFRFFVYGTLLTSIESIAGESFIVPRSPQIDGCTFAGWSPKLPQITPDEDMDFIAVFTPNEFIATLLVDGKVYKEIPYTYGQKSIDLPPVPEKTGYTGTWESYSLVVGGVTIRAIYKPVLHTFRFFVNGTLLTSFESISGESFIVPRSPQIDGYTFAGWSPKLPQITPDEDMDFSAVFTPNEYIATLLVDGNVYMEIPYTYGQKSIDLPPVPEKTGYTGMWESYSLVIGGVTIRAIYKPTDYTVRCMSGDVGGDGTVTLKDAVELSRFLAGGWDVDIHAPNSDVNGDGKLNLKDVILLQRYLSGGWDVKLYA